MFPDEQRIHAVVLCRSFEGVRHFQTVEELEDYIEDTINESFIEDYDELQKIENESGRVRLRRWGERTLDLDLLIYGNESIKNERLTVPHVGILERDFVVIPLLDLDADLQLNGQILKHSPLLQNPTLTMLEDQNWANIN